MATPAIAHFGTTIIEPPPLPGVEQAEVPITGALKDTLRFLQIFGFEPLLQNYYPNMGRQYIWRRGQPTDVDYVEKDNFTSYVAEARPPTAGPRVGDTVFRLTHADPRAVWRAWQKEGLGVAAVAADVPRFLAGDSQWLLLDGPDGQAYELGPTQPDTAGNHRIYVWTDAEQLDEVTAAYVSHFGLQPLAEGDFHGLGQVRLLSRAEPGASIGLLHSTGQLAPRWTDDIFREAGYSHFRMGAADMRRTLQETREAFPQGGDVAFVYFADSYLELVQAP